MSTSHARSWQQARPDQTETQRQKAAVKVQKQGWLTKGEKFLYSFMGVVVILAGIFIVSYSASTDTLNRDLQDLEKTVQYQQVKNEGLSYEMKSLSRPERITKIAREKGLKIQNAEVKQANAFNN
ncbi:cell division protein FtsL [Virgibacillus halotolerans]|uniref:cell division protein FtsL n=1 Tax=Virgibacillus halotolerans TaxID=1071053 RepID=UPI00195FE229|nr:cell division protein FtsL [Virgibacillus halotolerans]MBM7598690.1 cell division protein FtsL [Virgibacillus halotolerans]